MSQTFRDSTVGQCLRLLGGKHIIRYPEEHPNFELPAQYLQEKPATLDQPEKREPRTPSEIEDGRVSSEHTSQQITPTNSNTVEENHTLVTWYSDDDPDNPHNWSSNKKLWISLLLLVYTVSAYIGSSLYTASVTDITHIYGVSETVALLGLSLYVLGYGIGPLLFAPLSEIPAIGRNPLYTYTYIIFVALSVATALVDNFAGLMVLRFLLGFFGAPALANVGASYGDYFGPRQMPYVIALWGGGATLSPVSPFESLKLRKDICLPIIGSRSSSSWFCC
jgi:DHA1 family multidrug resistance protein-like MFS transporter